MSKPQYALYLSHSWLPEHVDLNISLWDYVWDDVLMYVDDNEEQAPPFYVSRIEHLIQRSDLFMAILVPPSERDDSRTDSPGWVTESPGFSPYVSFEMDLARRADLPRFVLYDVTLGFEPLEAQTSLVRYFGFDHREAEGVPRDVAGEIMDWLAAVAAVGPPKPPCPGEKAAVLIPAGQGSRLDTVRKALEAAGYRDVTDLSAAATDIEIIETLRMTDLLVADVADESVRDIYGVAHALAVPSIRIAGNDESPMPAILRSHSIGYQDDIISSTELADLGQEIRARAEAIHKPVITIDLLDEGKEFFEHRRSD